MAGPHIVQIDGYIYEFYTMGRPVQPFLDRFHREKAMMAEYKLDMTEFDRWMKRQGYTIVYLCSADDIVQHAWKSHEELTGHSPPSKSLNTMDNSNNRHNQEV